MTRSNVFRVKNAMLIANLFADAIGVSVVLFLTRVMPLRVTLSTLRRGCRVSNKEFGTEIIMSASTRTGLNGNFPLKQLPANRKKGKSLPVEVFTLK